MLSKKNYKGFTLVEVMVVVSIAVVGLLGISSLSMQNIQVQNINNDELVASMLAQEGVELMRNIRDNNWINLPYTEWGTNVLNLHAGETNATSTIDYLSPINYNVGNIDPLYHNSARLYIDPAGEYYSHAVAGATPTKFYRYIETSQISDAIKVVCHVNWRSGGRDHNYSIESHLYHWR